MKKFFFVIAAAAVFISCSKDQNVPTTAAPQKRIVKSVRTLNTGATESSEYKYDGNGKLLQEITDNSIYEYTFPSATQMVVISKNRSSGILQGISEYTVGSEGRVVKLDNKTPAGSIVFTTNYTYDAQGYLVGVETVNSGNTNYFEYAISNGNCMSVKFYYNGTLFNTTMYTHSANNAMVNFHYATGFPSGTLFGKMPKNTIDEVRVTNAAGLLTWHTKTTFQADAAGYIISETTRNMLTANETVTTFTYE